MIAVRRLLASSLGFWLALIPVFIWFLYPPMKRLHFGIDIVGGTYITLGVKTDEAIAYELQALAQGALAEIKKSEKIEPVLSKFDKDALIFKMTFADPGQAIKVQSFIENEYGKKRQTRKDLEFALNGNELSLAFSEGKKSEIRKQAVIGDKEVLQTRLNITGREETPVYISKASGVERIVVELPNVHDPIQARKMIGTQAMLDFRIIEAGPAATKDELLDKFDGELPEGMEILEGENSRSEGVAYYLVPSYSDITGRYLLKTKPTMVNDRHGELRMAVEFEFNADGGQKFYELTSQNLGRLLGAVLDKKVISAATINDKIGRHGTIQGAFSQEYAQELAALLKSGAFTAPLTFEEERHIGPALGSDSIHSGLISCLIGLALLFVFSVLYYKVSGLLAFSVLLYNLLLLLFILSQLKAALTLPGIAGLALTVGMAIDSSILIFERTKELLRQGSVTIAQAVWQGFSGSLATILDANITTFIVGLILFNFGTGPIKGFASTLIVGIFTTLISGLLVLRSIFEFRLSRNIQKLSI